MNTTACWESVCQAGSGGEMVGEQRGRETETDREGEGGGIERALQ